MKTPRKPTRNRHSKSETKPSRIEMPGIKGHFIALENSENSLSQSKTKSILMENQGGSDKIQRFME